MEQASFNFLAAVTICSDFGAQEKRSVMVSIISPSICYEVMGPDAMILVFWMLSFKPTFPLSSFHFQEALWFFFTFCRKGGIICISEVICISPSNLDSSLCFLQPIIIQLLLLFANKGPNNQSYGFSSSHVWMWELDHKEGWAQKNWCFWTVMLEKILESPLDTLGDQTSQS